MPEPILFRDRERRRGDRRPRRAGLLTRVRRRLADALRRGASNLRGRAAANRARNNR